MPDAAVQAVIEKPPSRRRRARDGSEGYEPGMSNAAIRVKLQRRRSVRRSQAVRSATQVRTGLVDEPFMTPLAGLNMLFRNLRVREVDLAEAKAVIDDVVTETTQLQTTQDMVTASRTSGRAASRRLSQAHAGPRASHAEILSSQVATSLLSASQDPLRSALSTQNELGSHGRKALALDAISVMCASRGLTVERLDWRVLRRQQDRVGSADVSAHERAVIAVDLYDPFFVLLLAESRPEPLTGSSGRQPTTATHHHGSGSSLQLLQLISTSPKPVPWRLVFKKQTRRLPHTQCTVAAVYKEAASHAAEPHARLLSRHSLLGGTPETTTPSSEDDVSSVPSMPPEDVTLDADWSTSGTLFTQQDATPDDPFYTIPRVERPGARAARRRTWTDALRGAK